MSGSTTLTDGAAAFKAARDGLLSLQGNADRARAEFEWPEVGEDFNWAQDWFDVIADGNEDTGLWIVEDDESEAKYSFETLRRRSNQVAHWLTELGIKRGDTVMLMLANRVELWEAMLGIMKVGAVMLPTAIVLGAEELGDRVDRAGVRWVITDEADAEKFDGFEGDFQLIAVGGARGAERVAIGLRNETMDLNRPRIPFADAFVDASGQERSDAPIERQVGGDHPAIIYFTSGTTSKPKMVLHTHVSYPVGHLSTMFWLGVRPGDTHMVITTPGWGKHAWSAFFAPWHVGATVFVYNYAKFDAAKLFKQLDRAEVNTFCAPPTVWRMLIQQGDSPKPRGLREALSAGEPLNPEVIGRIREWWGLEIRDGYGQTETTAILANSPGEIVQPGSMGRPLPGVNICLVDQRTGERIPADRERAEGELCLDLGAGRALNLMAGYYRDDEATERRKEGGVFHTGDVAQRDPAGRYTFVGRTDDIFKSSDYKVSPFEVESALIEHPAVVEAAVVGAPDATRLNITKAYVVLAAGFEPNDETAFEVLLHARKSLPPYMRVRRIEFYDLPKTVSGKIRRVELRDREQQFARRNERIPNEWREEDFPALKTRV
ncbi:AMP-binding protein [Gulosibacter molinativorax]|uniref:AMP-dependent synthetase n=1 Tax=Gulosibacter molinativorax TaxID=256821 RepID=A0ABT7C5T9_9MICO|nr:AMP-binding protein [Gulosibacter molinativorax]MDJ1370566.1 AMP-dependent synthetase [Gulosibacter molinativorax]QUY62021.1 AMP-dependent synthetase and ligase [Gulosibacter molinativorax]